MTVLDHPTRHRANSPTVSVVIPAFDEAATIERCLRALTRQTRPALEILVVDNRSTDDTATIVRRFATEHPDAGVQLLQQTVTQGLVPTRDLGFAVAAGDVFGRIDADSIVDPHWVARVADALGDGATGAVTGPVTYYDLPLLGTTRRSDDLLRRGLLRLGRRCPFLYGSNMAIRADAWHAIRHTVCPDADETLHEDIDLAVHLRMAGLAVGYAPRMRAAVSARRLGSPAASFLAYTERFAATYERHQVLHWTLTAPQALLRAVYWPMRLATVLDRRVGTAGAGQSVAA